MKAIVVRQPWASLIALGHKTIETRPGPPNGPMRPEGVRGLPGCRIEPGERIAIVAGALPPKEEQRVGDWVCREYSNDSWRMTNESSWLLPLGAVLATVEVRAALPVVDGLERHGSSWNGRERLLAYPDHLYWVKSSNGSGPVPTLDDQRPLGDFTPGRWGWLLTDPRTEFVPCKGRQGVFELPADVAERLL